MLIPFLKPRIKRPQFDYLISLSTPHGIMQHTMFNLPDPEHGYATDDNARALITAHLWKNEDSSRASVMRSLETAYLRFLKFAQTQDGQFYCYISFDLQKLKPGTGDWFGRAIFALAFLISNSQKFGTVSWSILIKSLPLIHERSFSIRTMAFLTLALYYLLEHHQKKDFLKHYELDAIQKTLSRWRDEFKKQADKNCTSEWFWPEEKITYDNGKVIQAYFILGVLLDDPSMTRMGKKMLDFYLKQTLKKDYFQAPGNHGFWPRDGKKPKYDEQAVEAYSAIAALVTASRILKKNEYYDQAREIYKWFWGKNRLKKSLVTNQTGAVFDGLQKETVNNNQGAESFLAVHLAYFCLTKRLHL